MEWNVNDACFENFIYFLFFLTDIWVLKALFLCVTETKEECSCLNIVKPGSTLKVNDQFGFKCESVVVFIVRRTVNGYSGWVIVVSKFWWERIECQALREDVFFAPCGRLHKFVNKDL